MSAIEEAQAEGMNPPDERLKEQWREEQNALKANLITHDTCAWMSAFSDPTTPGDAEHDGGHAQALKYVGGVDISFVKESMWDAVACLVVLEYPSLQVVYTACEDIKLTEPYIPGFLAFREVAFMTKLVEDLRASKPELLPQCILVDGNGILHPEGFGLACHLGVQCGIPTIGCGKTLFHIDGITIDDIKEKRPSLVKGGDWFALEGDSGTLWGAALRVSDSSKIPVFVSVGTMISLPTAVQVVHKCSKYKIPEPVRQADLISRECIRRKEVNG